MMKELTRKTVGYFGKWYVDYLKENHPQAYERFINRADCTDILKDLNDRCAVQMKVYMLWSFDNHVPSMNKKEDNDFYKLMYDHIVNEMKNNIFENCIDLFRYAEWMTA